MHDIQGDLMSICSRTRSAAAALILVAPLTAFAAPQTYVIDFVVTQGSIAPTAGSFTYDATIGFSNFTVTWNGVTVDLSTAANAPTLFTTAGGYAIGTAADAFSLMTNSLPQPRSYTNWAAFNNGGLGTYFGFKSGAGQPGGNESLVAVNGGSAAFGTDPTNLVQAGSFSIAAVPEPATAAMALAGLVILLGASRRRGG